MRMHDGRVSDSGSALSQEILLKGRPAASLHRALVCVGPGLLQMCGLGTASRARTTPKMLNPVWSVLFVSLLPQETRRWLAHFLGIPYSEWWMETRRSFPAARTLTNANTNNNTALICCYAHRLARGLSSPRPASPARRLIRLGGWFAIPAGLKMRLVSTADPISGLAARSPSGGLATLDWVVGATCRKEDMDGRLKCATPPDVPSFAFYPFWFQT
ncbi:hypothetical protein CSOJ01_04846 [Colletotrichum sojae]|uniref:Uncharacterized protein n=1 Tax=Colletotrichum sojae TaxID=2175907 RepID=A0A8H6JHH8_9PEZI|nr:hypothetical protein CSOJ01_04846 [Colletotrichum sojae]